MESNSIHNNFWKRNKKAKADEIASWVPREYLRPKDKPTRLFMDNEYINCGYLAVFPRICTAVYNALLFHCNTETQSAFPGIKTLLDHVGEKNPNTIATAIQILEHYGIILVLRRVGRFGRSSLYVFQDVKYWKPVDKHGARIKINDWQKTRYQKTQAEDINSAVSGPKIDTLTNLNKNYPNELTKRMRSLADQMNINKKPLEPRTNNEGLAIQGTSRDSIVRSAYESKKEDINPDINQPANAGKMQSGEHINIDINDPEITVEKRLVDTINLDTIEPLKNGEKMVADENEGIGLNDIRNEDIGLGTATF